MQDQKDIVQKIDSAAVKFLKSKLKLNSKQISEQIVEQEEVSSIIEKNGKFYKIIPVIDKKLSGKSIIYYENGLKYKGQMMNGKRSGFGTLNCTKQRKQFQYEGDWLDDLYHGKGKYMNTQPCERDAFIEMYDGEWKLGYFSGKGRCKFFNCDVYDGEWVDGQRSGYGTMTDQKNHKHYEGEWVNDHMQGKGKMYFNHSTYEGEWLQGIRHGYGIQTNMHPASDYHVYEGQWNQNRIHGKGVCYFADGSRIQGNWENGQSCGQAIKYFNTGQRFQGNLPKEFGIHYCNSNRIYCGEIKFKKDQGVGTIYYKDGEKYNGVWKGGERMGHGSYFKSNGIVEQGYFQSNLQGKGIILNELKGYRFQGDFYNGKKSGKGRVFFKNGIIIEGNWKNGLRDGVFTQITKNKCTELKFAKGLLVKKGKIKEKKKITERIFFKYFDLTNQLKPQASLIRSISI